MQLHLRLFSVWTHILLLSNINTVITASFHSYDYRCGCEPRKKRMFWKTISSDGKYQWLWVNGPEHVKGFSLFVSQCSHTAWTEVIFELFNHIKQKTLIYASLTPWNNKSSLPTTEEESHKHTFIRRGSATLTMSNMWDFILYQLLLLCRL